MTGTAVAALVVAGWGIASPSHATPRAASGPQTSVTLLLKAPNAAALQRLALTPMGSRSQRLSQLRALEPSQAQRNAVLTALRSSGFAVGGQTAWSVTASAPASTVSSLFGTRPALVHNASAAQHAAAVGALPKLPASLATLVSGAYPTTGGPAAYRHSTTGALKGVDFRNADTPAGVTPSTGQNDSGETIATLQLSNWNQSDLTHYASSQGLPDPVASGQYTSETVDGGPTDSTGDIEVDLDQESILSTAPSAKQTGYFAPNTQAGFDDVFAHVYDDVTGNAQAQKPNPHITAMSVSWGECEALTGASAINGLEPILDSLVAAGVTVFTSSGDDGIYDCRSTTGTGSDNSQEDVDYPSSSPVMVAVGGTNLSAATSAPNTGTNWTEKSWTCTNTSSCENTQTGTGGTGGGVSGSAQGTGANQGDFGGFAKPSYQSSNITSGPFAAPTKRMVPDIAADGDPQTGFNLYTSDVQYVLLCGGNTCQVGGTSLAAPISAAQFANLLGDNGITTGRGDIHSALYSAFTATKGLAATNPAKVFRDVTAGQNGAAANAHKDPSVLAQAGYDTNTGLGGVLWSALKPYLSGGTTGTAPKVTDSLTLTAHSTPKAVTTVARWKAVKGSSPLSSVSVTLSKGSTTVFSSTAASGTHSFQATRGATYTLTVTATDTAGRTTTKTATVTP